MSSRLFRMFGGLILSVLLVTLMSCSKKSADGDNGGDGDDGTPAPGAVSDLRAIDSTSVTATLRWTAPARSRQSGLITWYDLRYAAGPLTSLNWYQAIEVEDMPAPLPTGQIQTMMVTGLTPESTYYFALKCGNSDAHWSDISNVARVRLLAEFAIVFPDSSLEALIRELVSVATGDIHEPEVLTVRNLAANNRGIANLSGLEYFIRLQTAELNDNQISDLTPLAGLPSLTLINVGRNQLASLEPLAGMDALVQFSAPGNTISNLQPLAHLTNLQQLGLQQNNIQDIAPLRSLTRLRALYLGSNRISDITLLQYLTDLEELYLGADSVSDIRHLTSLTHLKQLDLSYNHISDIMPLATLTELTRLYLNGNQITSISALVSNSGLGPGDEVWLEGNPLSQRAQTVDIPALRMRGVTVNF